MGVMIAHDANDLKNLNRRDRNKMSVVKEGLEVSDVIVQEGVYTFEKVNEAVAEPVVYMIDRYVVGGFYRVHTDRGPDEKDSAFNRASFLDLLHRFLSAKDLSTDWDSLKDAEDELLINALSMMLDFPPEDKQALLEAPSLSTRRETLVTLMEFSLHTGDGEERLQ